MQIMSGETWMKCYLQTLSKKDVGALEATENSTIFKFGNVERVKADKFMRISSIEIDVWGCKSPLLIRENLIKKAGMRINVEIDTVTIFRKKKQDSLLTSSAYYCIPLGNHIGNDLETKEMLPKNEIIVMAIKGQNDKFTAGERKAIFSLWNLHWHSAITKALAEGDLYFLKSGLANNFRGEIVLAIFILIFE